MVAYRSASSDRGCVIRSTLRVDRVVRRLPGEDGSSSRTLCIVAACLLLAESDSEAAKLAGREGHTVYASWPISGALATTVAKLYVTMYVQTNIPDGCEQQLPLAAVRDLSACR